MFEEFESFINEVLNPEVEEDAKMSSDTFHAVETDDPENPLMVGGVPEYWAEVLDSQQGDNALGMGGTCGLVSVCNIQRMAGYENVTETDTCIQAVCTGNCSFDIFDLEGSGGSTPFEREALLEQVGIPATTYMNDEADPERIAEWVEGGHGVILGHSASLSSEEITMHLSNEEAAEQFPQFLEIVSVLPDDAEVSFSAEGVELMLDGVCVHMPWEDISALSPAAAEMPDQIPEGFCISVSREGVEVQLTGEALESQATVDEYGRVYSDHAITVTGTVRDVNGELLGLRVCDSGWIDDSGRDRFISVAQLEKCYTNVIRGSVVVTDDPIHRNGVPLKQASV